MGFVVAVEKTATVVAVSFICVVYYEVVKCSSLRKDLVDAAKWLCGVAK